jgi:hypothetical protein
MAKLRVHDLSVSPDGYGAGADESLNHPLGAGRMQLPEWAFATSVGAGERLWDFDEPVGYECVELVSAGTAADARFVRTAGGPVVRSR